MNTQMKRLHAAIAGRVQGVGFRYFTQDVAHRLGVLGWVRNRYDGSVEVLAEGDPAVLEQFLQALQRGPTSSNVTNIKKEWLDPTGEFDRFKIRMTG